MITSCFSYKPGYINTPKFQDQREVNLGVNIGNNAGAFASYNPINHLGILVDATTSIGARNGGQPFTIDNENRTFYNQLNQFDSTYAYRDFSIGGAVGTYWNYNEKLYHDFYVGFAKGKASAIDFPNQLFLFYFDEFETRVEAFEAEYRNFYFQSSLKFPISSAVNFSLDAKVNFLNFHTFSFIYSVPSGNLVDEKALKNYFNPNQRTAVQFGSTMSFNIDDVKGFAQFQLGLSDSVKQDFFSVRPFSFSIGFYIPLHQLWKKKEP